MFDVPTVVKTSDHNIKAHINDSKTLQCQFNAPTMNDVTIVVWTKNDMAINSSDHYRIKTFTKPGIENLIVSDLTINNITAADQGKFSCYCYYNRALVTSSKSVVSEEQSFTIYFKRRGYLNYYLCYVISLFSGEKFAVKYTAVGIAAASLLLLLGVASMLVMYIKYCRRWHNGMSGKIIMLFMVILIYHGTAEKMCLVEEEQDTCGAGEYNSI